MRQQSTILCQELVYNTIALYRLDDDMPMLWDWPFAEDGLAKCEIVGDKFTVHLKFSYLKSASKIVVTVSTKQIRQEITT